MSDDNQKPRKLPLWNSCVEKMKKDGIGYGSTYNAEFFEEHLGEPRDTMEFALGVSHVRRALEHDGFYLSGRGGNGTDFRVVPVERNCEVLKKYGRDARMALQRGCILGTSTPLHLLGAEDRRRHEAILERLAMQSVLVARTNGIVKVVKRHSPKLLSVKK